MVARQASGSTVMSNTEYFIKYLYDAPNVLMGDMNV